MLYDPNGQLYYPFENQANDYSGHARHGTVFGSGVYATRPNAGRCLYFDGTGDYVATPSFSLGDTSKHVLVFACWTRCKLYASNNQTLLSDNAPSATIGFLYCIRPTNTNTLRWRYADGAGIRTIDVADYFKTPYNDTWLHLLIVCDYAGKVTYFYRNGSLFGSSVAMTGTPVFPSSNYVNYIGSYNTTLYMLTDGYLANIYLGTLQAMIPLPQMQANANRLMLGMNPIW
jgi:hypothetical protein